MNFNLKYLILPLSIMVCINNNCINAMEEESEYNSDNMEEYEYNDEEIDFSEDFKREYKDILETDYEELLPIWMNNEIQKILEKLQKGKSINEQEVDNTIEIKYYIKLANFEKEIDNTQKSIQNSCSKINNNESYRDAIKRLNKLHNEKSKILDTIIHSKNKEDSMSAMKALADAAMHTTDKDLDEIILGNNTNSSINKDKDYCKELINFVYPEDKNKELKNIVKEAYFYLLREKDSEEGLILKGGKQFSKEKVLDITENFSNFLNEEIEFDKLDKESLKKIWEKITDDLKNNKSVSSYVTTNYCDNYCEIIEDNEDKNDIHKIYSELEKYRELQKKITESKEFKPEEKFKKLESKTKFICLENYLEKYRKLQKEYQIHLLSKTIEDLNNADSIFVISDFLNEFEKYFSKSDYKYQKLLEFVLYYSINELIKTIVGDNYSNPKEILEFFNNGQELIDTYSYSNNLGHKNVPESSNHTYSRYAMVINYTLQKLVYCLGKSENNTLDICTSKVRDYIIKILRDKFKNIDERLIDKENIKKKFCTTDVIMCNGISKLSNAYVSNILANYGKTKIENIIEQKLFVQKDEQVSNSKNKKTRKFLKDEIRKYIEDKISMSKEDEINKDKVLTLHNVKRNSKLVTDLANDVKFHFSNLLNEIVNEIFNQIVLPKKIDIELFNFVLKNEFKTTTISPKLLDKSVDDFSNPHDYRRIKSEKKFIIEKFDRHLKQEVFDHYLTDDLLYNNEMLNTCIVNEVFNCIFGNSADIKKELEYLNDNYHTNQILGKIKNSYDIKNILDYINNYGFERKLFTGVRKKYIKNKGNNKVINTTNTESNSQINNGSEINTNSNNQNIINENDNQYEISTSSNQINMNIENNGIINDMGNYDLNYDLNEGDNVI